MSIHNSCKYETYYRGKYNTHATYNSNVPVASQNFQTNCVNNQNSFLPYLLSTVDFGGSSSATNDASSSTLEAQTISNASTSTPDASSTPSQLTTAGAGEAGDQQAENEAVKTDDEINQIIASILEEAGIDYESKSDEFKYDILNKYKVMIDVASRKGETLSDDIIELRIKNYAIGWEFTDFETRAVYDKTATYKYNSDTTLPEEEQFAKLKQHYQELSAGYIEHYDGDGNGSINLYEMFTFELAEYYESQGQSKQEAMNKAINKTREYMSMSFTDIQKSTDTSFEMSILKQLQVRYGVLEDQANGMDINSLITLDQDEVQAYLFAKAQYLDNKNSISANESFAVDADIMGARGDEGDSKIDLYLKGAREFLGL